jgi:transposase
MSDIVIHLRRGGTADGRFCISSTPLQRHRLHECVLKHLSETYPNDRIVLVCDSASWHRAKALEPPQNIRIVYLPPATPEMNPIEQIWKEIRKRGFKNEVFQTLEKVVDRLCFVIRSLSSETIKSITARDWIIKCF